MMTKNHRPFVSFILILIVVCALAATVWPSLVQATGPDLPPREPPAPAPAPGGDDGDDTPAGAHIELHVQGAAAGAWTAVQWQNELGNWYDVEGWQGVLNGGKKVWWVAEKDFGTGPFQWVATQGRGGPVLGDSPSFNLPHEPNQILQIEVSLGP